MDHSYSPESLERMSSPEWGLEDDSPPPAPRVLETRVKSESAPPFHPTSVDAENGSTAQESIFVSDDDVKEVTPVKRQPTKVQTIPSSSEDDEPIASTRQRHNLRSSARKPTKPSPKKPAKETVEKPSPLPTRPRPILKNDLVAKKAVIKSIESYWGKNWVKTHIPKCHRPLVSTHTPPSSFPSTNTPQYKNGTKRNYNRAHENDPMKWLPLVLKSILMVAKLTKNRKWLAATMNEVVRYRVKNTGNRKPQLCSTDFDVMEDMLVKDWEVEYAFGVWYKHLLVKAKEIQTEEDVDRIMKVSEEEDDGEEGSGGGQDSSGGSDSESDDDVKQKFGGGASDGHRVMGGHHQSPSSTPRGKKHKTPKKEVVKEESPTLPHPPPPGMYGGHYGQPLIDPWGRPIIPPQGGGFGGYGGYPAFNGYGYPPYGQPPFPIQGRQSSHPSPFPPFSRQPPPIAHPPGTPNPARAGRDTPTIKRESSGLDGEQAENFGDPGVVGHEGAMADDVDMAENEETIKAAMAVVQAELKLARLHHKQVSMASMAKK
ncbi:hypothetical protein J4E83_009730 [Alternaria metachromatica]|uniref:uncharacterized protein n=1 Tax=Alternaria metachromatica TaxID=283354 RepID=UPI0020C545BA|nr:uncharacterized protein J4E83_009730 [Alternaria metachromatica]KAI4606975.1 hypothetical protein J4E83_009730 [Alternaria metachromatica]